MRLLLIVLVAFLILVPVQRAACQPTPAPIKSACDSTTELYPSWTTAQKHWLNDVFTPSVQRRVAAHWYTKQVGNIPPDHVCVGFHVEMDGTITAIEMLEPSHSDSLNQSALQAVKDASPFDPLPDGLPVKFIEVKYAFRYREHQTQTYVPLSEQPFSITKSTPGNHDFAVVVSIGAPFDVPFDELRPPLENWAASIQQKWESNVSSSKDQNLVEIEADIQADGSIANINISRPSGNGPIDHAALDSLSGTKLVMTATIKIPVKIRIDFLAHRTPDDVVVATKF